jgi:hypothetical protein
MSQIRITKTVELEEVLTYLRARWPLMDEVEIVKMAISRFFLEQKEELDSLPVEYLTDKQAEGIGISREQIKQGQSAKYNSAKFLKEVVL